MAKKKKRSGHLTERELHERRRYGFFWYDWLWRILRPALVFLASFVIVCGLVYTGYRKIDAMFFAPVDAKDTTAVEFEVASGSSLSTVSRNLEEAGLIRNHSVFKYMADFMGMGQKIQSGDYELTRAMSATDILDELISGDGDPRSARLWRRQAADGDDHDHPRLDGGGYRKLPGGAQNPEKRRRIPEPVQNGRGVQRVLLHRGHAGEGRQRSAPVRAGGLSLAEHL